MSTQLALRVPTLEWSQRSAFKEARGLSWVDATINPNAAPFKQRSYDGKRSTCRNLSGRRSAVARRRVRLHRRHANAPLFRMCSEPRRFRHLPYAAFLPPPVAELARDAQRRGRPTVHEAMLFVMARLEWLVASRQYLWSPLSSTPKLLASIVEAFGVDAGLHRNNDGNLLRLTALIPSWHPHRGTVERAHQLLSTCGQGAQAENVSWLIRSGPRPAALDGEVLACRSTEWWTHRQRGNARPVYRIQNGLLRFQPQGDEAFVLRQEDILISWSPGEPLPRDLVRLLPVWTVVRLVALPAHTTRSTT